MNKKRIYIAGPDVFELDSMEVGHKYKTLCTEYGFLGMYPLDNVVNFNQTKQQIAQEIYKANINLIHQADIIIANLNPFRGKEPDSGTIWECGYAKGLGKEVYGYMSKKIDYIDTFRMSEKSRTEDGRYIDDRDRVIEDFNYPINLMIACSVSDIIEGGFEDVLQKL